MNGGTAASIPDALRREEYRGRAHPARRDSYARNYRRTAFARDEPATTPCSHMSDWAGIRVRSRIIKALLPLDHAGTRVVCEREVRASLRRAAEVGLASICSCQISDFKFQISDSDLRYQI